MNLKNLVDRYAESHDYGIAPESVRQLRYAVAALAGHLGRAPATADLTDATVNAWIDARRAVRSAHTVRTQRGSILTLWRFAWLQDLVPDPPKKIRRLRMPAPDPHGWTCDHVGRLTELAAQLPGRIRHHGMRRGIHMAAFVRLAWDTGFRLGDCLALRGSDIAPDGRIDVAQSKTGVRQCVRVWPATVALVADTLADAPRQVIFPCARRWYQRETSRLARAAGLGGSVKWIRRGVGTAAEIAGAYGSRMLGHADPRTLRFYLDRAALEPVVAPALGGHESAHVRAGR